MNKTLLIIKNELSETLRNKGMLFVAFGVPLILWVVFLGAQGVQKMAEETGKTKTINAGSLGVEREGFVDKSGLIKTIPPLLPPGALTAYPNELSARKALKAKKISAFYIIPPDYLDTGRLAAVRRELKVAPGQEQCVSIDLLLQHNILGGNISLTARLREPLMLKETDLSTSSQDASENDNASLIQLAMLGIFFVLITTASGQLLKSVGKEKSNRVMESLLTSLTPQQLLTGKTIGLGIFSILQVIAWLGTGYALLHLSGRTLALPADFSIPPTVLAWGLLFFIFGYALYASLMAGAGAMVSNMKEVTGASWSAMGPLIIGYLLMEFSVENLNAILPTALSLFPLTSPIAMPTRLGGGNISWWQPYLALTLLALTTYIVNRSAARLFRAQYLLSGQPFSVPNFWRALLRSG